MEYERPNSTLRTYPVVDVMYGSPHIHNRPYPKRNFLVLEYIR
jgi:hypothetical protein